MKKIFLTVDTECHDINNQDRYIWGKTKSGKEYGLRLYLELGKELNIPINFFVDVAECKRYGIGFVRNIVELIQSYNQPVYFHLHPNFITGDDDRSYLWQYNTEEKRDILKEAYNYYKEVTGLDSCKAFRAGRYGSDTELYELMTSVMGEGVIDLSYNYGDGKGMCHLSYDEVNTVNGVVKYKGCWIFPNTSYIALKLKRVVTLGIDTSQTTIGEFRRFFRKSSSDNIIVTSHSWNFIKSFFFYKKRVWGSDNEVRKFRKMVRIAREHGFEFEKVENLELTDNNSSDNNICDLCSTSGERLYSLYSNFIRFQKIACLSPKYFKIYAVFYIFVVLIILLLLYICF